MRGRSSGISRSVLACLAIIGGAGLGGLAAGFNARGGLSPEPSSTVVATIANIAHSETVNLRFPADWAEASVEPASRTVTLASADAGTFINPQPTYASGDTDAPATMVEAAPKPAPARLAVASLVPTPPKRPKPHSNA